MSTPHGVIIGIRPKMLMIAVASALVGCSQPSDGKKGQDVMDAHCDKEMARVASHRVFFGHQSVGRDILEGLAELGSGTTRLRFSRPGAIVASDTAFFAEDAIGVNGDPASKCHAFVAAVDAMTASAPDVVLMKFCYVDVTEDSDVASVLAAYAGVVDTIRARHPGVRLVHVTMPLTTRSPGWKRMLNRLLGRGEAADLANVNRERYNTGLRTRYPGDPLFDLAAVESTGPDGSRSAFELNGEIGYALVEEYTTDGGHLNARGRMAAARELVRVLATIP
jgi:hypothetical protein